jgi:hypothetical protein
MEHLLLLAVTFVVAGAGAYLGSYLKRKGENLATREDVDKLLIQLSAVTQVTKVIEAKISNDVWERQRKWDIRRDALFEGIRSLGAVEDALDVLACTYVGMYSWKEGSPSADKETARLAWTNRQVEAIERYQKAKLDFEQARMLSSLVSSQAVSDRFDDFASLIARTADDIMSGRNSEPTKLLPKTSLGGKRLVEAIREELGLNYRTEIA